MDNFEQWQAQECSMLGLSVEQHNKIIEVARELNIVNPGRDAYGAIVSMLDRSIADATRIPAHLFEATEKAGSRPLDLRELRSRFQRP